MNTFLSFSSRDTFVPRLLTRLTAQNLNIWNYSNEGEEIPGGERITLYLRERVQASTLFIPVVSPNSMASAYTRFEVESALNCQRHNGLRIIPLVECTVLDIAAWSGPYADLRSIRYHVFSGDHEHIMQMEEAIRRLCHDISVPFVSLVADTPRLPLMGRVDAELRQRFPRDTERTNALYVRLDRAICICKVSLSKGEHLQALQAIEYFLAMVENEYSGVSFYYPYVARAVCLIALGRLPEAVQALTALQNHPSCEESVFGALGHIRQTQGLYAEAAELYREAFKRDPEDAAAATGVVVNEVLGDVPTIDLAKACRVIKEGKYLTPSEREQSHYAHALGLAKLGQSAEAAEILYRLLEHDNAPVPIIINLANILVDMQQIHKAQTLLVTSMSTHSNDISLASWTTRFFLETDQPQKAAHYAEIAVKLAPDSLGAMFELLLAQRRANITEYTTTAKQLASMLPRNKEDFYYTGYANWVLKNMERSKYDWERSGTSKFYDCIE